MKKVDLNKNSLPLSFTVSPECKLAVQQPPACPLPGERTGREKEGFVCVYVPLVSSCLLRHLHLLCSELYPCVSPLGIPAIPTPNALPAERHDLSSAVPWSYTIVPAGCVWGWAPWALHGHQTPDTQGTHRPAPLRHSKFLPWSSNLIPQDLSRRAVPTGGVG